MALREQEAIGRSAIVERECKGAIKAPDVRAAIEVSISALEGCEKE